MSYVSLKVKVPMMGMLLLRKVASMGTDEMKVSGVTRRPDQFHAPDSPHQNYN